MEAVSIADDDNRSSAQIDPLLSDVLQRVDCGIAVFDKDFRLIACNKQYGMLCGYDSEQTAPYTLLHDLIRLTLQRQNYDSKEIEVAISTTLLRLKVGGTQKFVFQAPDGKSVGVARSRHPDGNLVETVREVSGEQSGELGRLKSVAEVAHSRLMHALDAMIDGFALWDPDDRLVLYNKNYIDLNPHIADLVKPGAHFETMLRQGVARGGFNQLGMDNEAFVQWQLQQHFNPGTPNEHQLADGRWIRVIERQTEDGSIVGTRTDVTELRNRERQLESISGVLDQTNRRLEFALNNMIQGLCMFDAQQRLILCNHQYLEMYGFSPEIVKPGIALSDIMRYSISLGNYREEDAQAALEARHDPDRLKKKTTIKQYLRDGRVMAVMNAPLPSGGSIATYQDITILEQHEAALVRHAHHLERSNRELQEFAYVASHDLQEPLRKIEAFGDRLRGKFGEQLPDDGKLYIDKMQNAASRMRALINDLLSYSRVTTKARPFVDVDMNEVLQGVLSDLQIRIQETGATLEIQPLPNLRADSMQMRQLFQNLIANALKFRKSDVTPTVAIHVEMVERSNDIGIAQPFWRFSVADNGIGFDNQYKEQIFAVFQRLHGRNEYEGTGIGLATCRKIVERHGGFIDANGVVDQGATFTVDLPERGPTNLGVGAVHGE